MALTHQTFFGLCFFTSFLIFHANSVHISDTISHSLTMRERFEQWIAQHGRVYENEAEKEKRFFLFKNNVKRIDEFNSDGANKSYKQAPNAFTDLTTEEFLARYTGSHIPFDSKNVTKLSIFRYNTSNEVPGFIDWRQNGAVTSVKDQGECECCWAFATVAALEGIYKIKKGDLLDFSEQNLVDCDTISHGCSYGYMSAAYEYMKTKGILLEQPCPYQAKQGQCESGGFRFIIQDYQRVGPKDVNALMAAVAQQPVSINIDARGLGSYGGGVYDGGCSYNTNHAIVVVGYGKDDTTGKDYWLLKNSWGQDWGEDGYMKLLRDESACPITTYPLIPILRN